LVSIAAMWRLPVLVLHSPDTEASYQSGAKRRPAIVLAHAGRGDGVLCRVTSTSYGDAKAMAVAED